MVLIHTGVVLEHMVQRCKSVTLDKPAAWFCKEVSMTDLTVDEKHIVSLLSRNPQVTKVVRSDDEELYWYDGCGGWSDPEMHKMQDHHAHAVNSLLSRALIEVTEERVSALLMVTKLIDGRRVTECAGKWSGGQLVRLSNNLFSRVVLKSVL